jgi:hypothetical protein
LRWRCFIVLIARPRPSAGEDAVHLGLVAVSGGTDFGFVPVCRGLDLLFDAGLTD